MALGVGALRASMELMVALLLVVLLYTVARSLQGPATVYSLTLVPRLEAPADARGIVRVTVDTIEPRGFSLDAGASGRVLVALHVAYTGTGCITAYSCPAIARLERAGSGSLSLGLAVEGGDYCSPVTVCSGEEKPLQLTLLLRAEEGGGLRVQLVASGSSRWIGLQPPSTLIEGSNAPIGVHVEEIAVITKPARASRLYSVDSVDKQVLAAGETG